MMTQHQSVLTAEVLSAIEPKSDGVYLDATFGGGGHSRALLEATAPTGRVIGIDLDESVQPFAEKLASEYPGRFRFEALSYVATEKLGEEFDGVIMDLGLSTDQLESSFPTQSSSASPQKSSGRGFSFQKTNEPLDLRFNSASGQTAAEFLRQAPLPRIEQVFRDYAEDRYWRRLSAKIVETRRRNLIRTVGDFISLVGNSDPKVLAPLFQGLRIEVNHELDNLKRGLQVISGLLKTSGYLAVISFHSLEDRIVKEFFRESELEVITKKPVLPSDEEVSRNPRSRSAKLRVAKRR